jgi:hypothetical protein
VNGRLYWLVLGVLATWRLTHLLVAEAGPWAIMERLRRSAGAGILAELLACFYCASLWVALPVAAVIGDGWRERGLLWLALSGGAIAVERMTNHEMPVASAPWQEDPEDDDGMLWQEQDRGADSG